MFIFVKVDTPTAIVVETMLDAPMFEFAPAIVAAIVGVTG
jgi:hypothetical protein